MAKKCGKYGCGNKLTFDRQRLGDIRATESLGTLINYQTFPNLSTWTTSGTVINASGGVLLLTATSSVFTNYILENGYGYSCLEDFEMTSEFIVTEKSATSNGFCLGLYDTSNTNVYNVCRFSTNSGVTGGIITFILQNSAYSVSSTAIAFALNDSMRLTFGRRKIGGQDQYYSQIENLTSPVTPVTLTFNISYVTPLTNGVNGSGTWRYGIFALRGTLTVNTFKVTSQAQKYCRTLFVGDSITRGLYATSMALRFADMVNPRTFQVVGGPGDVTQDLINRINEIKSLFPRFVILCIGTNDVANGVANATIVANIATIVTALQSAGAYVYVCRQLPRNAVNVTTLNTSIVSAYPNNNIDLYTPMQTAGSPTPALFAADLVHPNATGHATIANTISSLVPDII